MKSKQEKEEKEELKEMEKNLFGSYIRIRIG